jgi:OOP family OmpA-OmpF porin
MNGPIRIALMAACVAFVAGCGGMELQKAEGVAPEGSAFDRNLYSGYVALAKAEFDEGDYLDSDVFALRAEEAAKSGRVQPEMISARDLPANKVGELTDARLRLMTALSAGAADSKPLTAAEAQVAFDCWMQEQEENFQPDDIAACRGRFMTAMAQLEEKPMVAAVPAPVAPAPAPVMMAKPQNFVVLFDFDKSNLTVEARTKLADVVAAVNKWNYGRIDIGGYTDLMGSDTYNQVLSEQRANAVINFLVDSGIEAGKIIGKGYGKADPVVNVQAPEMENRRVEIKLEP